MDGRGPLTRGGQSAPLAPCSNVNLIRKHPPSHTQNLGTHGPGSGTHRSNHRIARPWLPSLEEPCQRSGQEEEISQRRHRQSKHLSQARVAEPAHEPKHSGQHSLMLYNVQRNLDATNCIHSQKILETLQWIFWLPAERRRLLCAWKGVMGNLGKYKDMAGFGSHGNARKILRVQYGRPSTSGVFTQKEL